MNEWNGNGRKRYAENKKKKKINGKRWVESKRGKKALKGFSTDFETWLIVEMNNLPSLVFYPF